MDSKTVYVTDKDGRSEPATVILCPLCGNDAFCIFAVNGHNHLQCTQCDTSFCQSGGDCGVRKEREK